MFIYLVAIVAIICSIFGLTYSQPSLQVIRDVGEQLSTIRLPAFSLSTPLIGHPLAGVAGDNGNAGVAGISSQQSLEIFNDQMIEEVGRAKWSEEDLTSKDDRYPIERRTFDQKLADANQIGLAASLWSPAPQKDSEKAMKDIMNQKYASDSKPPPKITTNTIFNMIQYETFKEAMAVLQKQQEEEARAAAENEQNEKLIKDDDQTVPDDEKENLIPGRGNIN